MARKRVDRGADYAFLVRKEELALDHHTKGGICKTCGEAFVGPRNRKYCDKHSQYTRYSGKG